MPKCIWSSFLEGNLTLNVFVCVYKKARHLSEWNKEGNRPMCMYKEAYNNVAYIGGNIEIA